MNRSGPREVLIEPYCVFCGQSTQHTDRHSFKRSIGAWESEITFIFPAHPTCLQTAKRPLRNILILASGVAVAGAVAVLIFANMALMHDPVCVIPTAALVAASLGVYIYTRLKENFEKNYNPKLEYYYDTHVQGETTYDLFSGVSTKQQESQTLIVDADRDSSAQYRTIYDAVNAARDGDRILVRPGKYNARNRIDPQAGYRYGPILLNKRVEIIGDGPRGEIIVGEAADEGCFRMQTKQATLRNLTLENPYRSNYAIEVIVGQLLVEDCSITSKGLAGVSIKGPMSEVTLKSCDVFGSNEGGVFVHNRALAHIEDCNIYSNRFSGVEVRDGGQVLIRGSKIHDGNSFGVFFNTNGLGRVEDCDIFKNAKSNVLVENGKGIVQGGQLHESEQCGLLVINGQATAEGCDIFNNGLSNVEFRDKANGTLRQCKIHKATRNGLYVYDQACVEVEACDVFENGMDGVEIKTAGNPTIRRSKINRNAYQAIWVHDNGKATVEDCDLTGNERGSWLIESGGQVSKKNNQESEPEPAPTDGPPAPEPEAAKEATVSPTDTESDGEVTQPDTPNPEASTPPEDVEDTNLIPPITAAHTSLALIESSQLSTPGAGGDAFQQAVQCMNSQDTDGAIRSFEEALNKGLDPLRQGYAHANLGSLMLKKDDLPGAIVHFLKVLDGDQALYEAAHDAAQYLNVILVELGRNEEAVLLSQLAAKTQAKLGYSLSPSAADDVRKMVRATKP